MTRKAKLLYACVLLILFIGGLWTANTQIQGGGDPALANLGGEFTLNSIDGPTSLSDFEGQVVALYFGFMTCPEICPTALSAIAASINGLTPEEQAQVQPLFITVDPERDTLDLLADYTGYFSGNMIGLSGDLAYLENLVKQYGAYFRHIPLANSDLGYTVDHTSRIYLIDQDGKLRETLPHGVTVPQIEASIRKYL